MFDVLSALVETASAKAKKFTDEGLELVKQSGLLNLGVEEEEKTKKCTGAVKSGETPSGECVDGEETVKGDSLETCVVKEMIVSPPLNWESPAEEWTLIMESLFMEENSCIIPPQRIMNEKMLASKLCDLLKLESIANVPEPPTVGDCEPSEEVVEWLMSSPARLVFRSSLVPRHVSDEKYWVNICWRLHLFRMCINADQLLDVMEAVSTEPEPADATSTVRKVNVGAPNNARYWQNLREVLKTRRKTMAWLEEQTTCVRHEIELATSNLKLLSSLVAKRETSELGDSVSESCKYHKTKLGRLMGELKSQQEKLVNSDLCPDQGALFLQLVETNEQLRLKLEAYASLLSKTPSNCWEEVFNGENEDDKSKGNKSEGNSTENIVFEAVLPWETETKEE